MRKKVKLGTQQVLKKIEIQDTTRKWEELILSQLELRNTVNLTDVFFQIAKEQESQVAVTVLFNIIKLTTTDKNLVLETNYEIQRDNIVKNIALWKMTIKKI